MTNPLPVVCCHHCKLKTLNNYDDGYPILCKQQHLMVNLVMAEIDRSQLIAGCKFTALADRTERTTKCDGTLFVLDVDKALLRATGETDEC